MILLCDSLTGFLDVAHAQVQALPCPAKLLSSVLHTMLLSRPRGVGARPAIEVASHGRAQLLTRLELYDHDLQRARRKLGICSVFRTTYRARLVFDQRINAADYQIRREPNPFPSPAPIQCNTAVPAVISAL